MVPDRPTRARRRAAPLAVVAFLILPCAAAAGPQEVELLPEPLPAAPADASRPGVAAPFDLFLNGVKGPTAVVLLGEDDVWVAVEDLVAAGLPELRGVTPVHADGRRWLSLRALAPELAYAVDEAEFALRLVASATLLGRARIDLSPAVRPTRMEEPSDPAVFLNYAAQGREDGAGAGSLELGASSEDWSLTSGVSRTFDGRFDRGLTTAAREWRRPMLRLALGDLAASSGPLGGGAVLGGLSFGRDFSLDPYFTRVPLPQARAVALTPSTLEVYVDGRLATRQAIPAGTIDLANLPVLTGRGTARAVIRDAFGRTQEIDSEYAVVESLLAPGLSDFAYQLGFTREDFEQEALDYGRALFMGRHRVGLTPWLTAGARLEAGVELVSGGPTLTAATPFGDVDLAGAASGRAGEAGGAGLVAWRWRARRFSSSATLRWVSERFSHATLEPDGDRALRDLTCAVSVPVARRASLYLEAGAGRWRDAGSMTRGSARLQLGVGQSSAVSLGSGWTRDPSGSTDVTALLLFSWATGTTSSAEWSLERRGGTPVGAARVQQALPRGPGIGYRVETEVASGEEHPGGLAELRWQNDLARVEVLAERRPGLERTTASVSGAVVGMGEAFYLTRPVQEGFALVEVPGVDGVRVEMGGQEVGRTSRGGRLLVPDLLPYHANRLSITASDVPLDYDLGELERLVAPPRRGAAHVRFAVEKVRSLTGTLAVALTGGTVTPAYGEVTVAGVDGAVSPIGSDGRFYLERVPAGRHRATIVHGAGVCELALEVPERSDALLDLGALRCDQRPASATTGSGEAAPAAAVAPPVGPPSASTVTTTSSAPLASARR